MKPINVLSLFGGIECGRMALDKLGIPIGQYFSAEVDPYAIKCSGHNFPDIVHIGSVTEIESDGETLYSPGQYYGQDMKEFTGKIDILIGGPPCQDLSIAGKRAGLSGERSGLFHEYVRILKETKPRLFLMENVASMPKEAKEEITRELFGIEPIMINSALVSAQSRKRLYWVGKQNDDGTYSKVDISQPQDRGIVLNDILEDIPMNDPRWKPLREEFVEKVKEKQKAFAVTATYAGACPQDHIRSNRTIIFQRPRGKNSGGVFDEKIPNVNASAFQDNNLIVGMAHRNRGNGKEPEFNGTEKANSLTTVRSDSEVLAIPEYLWRKLTVRECARAQTIPESYDFSVLSNSRAYKGIGNGWCVEVVKHIFNHIDF